MKKGIEKDNDELYEQTTNNNNPTLRGRQNWHKYWKGRGMISFLRVFAYICIWTTPFQVAFILWGIGIVAVTDYSILSLSNIEFIRNYLGFLFPIIEWLYTWFWNALLDWVFSLPMILHQTLKAIFSTWLGFWILKNTR